MIAKSKLSAQSDWDQIQAGAKALLSSSAVGAWTYRASTSFFDAAYLSFAEEQDAVLFKLHYSELISTDEEEMKRKFSPAFRFVDAYQEKRTHLVATKGQQAADLELADERAIIQGLPEHVKDLRAATRI
jgi:hypothetical protein